MAATAENDAVTFGRLIREVREARGWKLETLALEVFGGDKGRLSKIETGKAGRINSGTARLLAEALAIDPAKIPPSLRWPEAVEIMEIRDTSFRDQLVSANAALARQFGIKEGMLIALGRRYAEGNPHDFDAALAGLERALEVARDERGRLPINISAAVNAVIERIDELNDRGELEAGQEALDAELAALNEEDARRSAERARLYEKGVAQAIMTRNVENACRFVLAQIELDAPVDFEGRSLLLQTTFTDWFDRGSKKGLNFDLEVAIVLARIRVDRAEMANDRGATRNSLGNALSILGERESDTARLEEAVQAYRAALEEWTREYLPFDWAAAQNNLGNALLALGEREEENVRLEEAVQAYRAALLEWTREHVPFDWATAQNNLGNALLALGEREEGETVRLEEAVQAYRAALEEWKRDRVPLDWAMTQNNLGNALSMLGERESGTARLEEAVQACRAALEEWTRDRVPLGWATIQNNLGNALSTLGERGGGTQRLEEAVQAYRAALEEWTRERVPLDWAATQNNLGNALLALGTRESGTARLEESVHACRAALEEWTRERVPRRWAMTQSNLGNALRTLGEREVGTERLDEARQAYVFALEELTGEQAPFMRQGVQKNLEEVLAELRRRQSY